MKVMNGNLSLSFVRKCVYVCTQAKSDLGILCLHTFIYKSKMSTIIFYCTHTHTQIYTNKTTYIIMAHSRSKSNPITHTRTHVLTLMTLFNPFTYTHAHTVEWRSWNDDNEAHSRSHSWKPSFSISLILFQWRLSLSVKRKSFEITHTGAHVTHIKPPRLWCEMEWNWANKRVEIN